MASDQMTSHAISMGPSGVALARIFTHVNVFVMPEVARHCLLRLVLEIPR